ncbi:MAG: hypothetical protein LWY06_08255, partial [Firmicutes bacterium]|nr:hypothetical protein [Bacillota bacterium]
TPARPCQALWVTTNPTQHPSIPIKSTKKFPKKKKTPGFLRGFGKDGLVDCVKPFSKSIFQVKKSNLAKLMASAQEQNSIKEKPLKMVYASGYAILLANKLKPGVGSRAMPLN